MTSFKTANQLLRSGKLDDAVAAYREAIALNPGFSLAHHNLGEALVKAGRFDEAEAAFRRAVELNPQAVWSLFQLGELLRGRERFEEAVGFLRGAVELKSEVAEFNLGLGAALVKLGSALEEGEACLRRAVELNPFLAEAYYYLGAAADRRGQPSEAVEFYSRGLELNPSGVECGLGLGSALGKLGRWSEAVERYGQMELASGPSGEVCFGLGQALGQLGRWEEAAIEYRRAVALGLASAEVRHHLGYALGQLGRWEEGVVEYRLVVEVNPKSATVRHQLGYGLMRLGRWGEAAVELRRAVELYPGSAVVWQQLGDVLRELGEREEAVGVYRRAKELNPEVVGHFSDLSLALQAEPIKDAAVFVGIASIPQRVHSLKLTIESLINQVDFIGVFLDKYDVVPEYLKDYGDRVKIIRSHQVDRDLGDAGKFFWVESHQGYYFTCDDDLIYPPDYIFRTISRIKSFRTPVVIGWHGGLVLSPFTDYYNPNSRRIFSFNAPRPVITPVHILGSGCLGFHTSHISVKLSDFKTPNMADVYFALLGQKQRVPFAVIEHLKGEITEAENSQDVSISKHSSSDVEMSRQNTKVMQNKLVSKSNWKIHYTNRKLRILVIGRFIINRKGGVFKSSKLLVEGLTKLGHKVEKVCISESDKVGLFIDEYVNHPLQFALFYLPDPERPDFGNVMKQVELLASRGCVCAVNFSINLYPKRSQWISKKVRELNANFNYPRIFIAAFTNSTGLIKELDDVRDYIITIPKTIDPGKTISFSYMEREGIFLGDLAKLCNNKLTVPKIIKWIEQIRINLPHVNIYAIKHYDTKAKLLDYIKILPYSEKGLGEILSQFRLNVCLTPGATFEMIPVEAAMAGTPVVHASMPQSLSEYLSPASVEVNSPEELGEMCRTIYEREDLWCHLSAASTGIHQTSSVDRIIAVIELSIRKCLLRSNCR